MDDKMKKEIESTQRMLKKHLGPMHVVYTTPLGGYSNEELLDLYHKLNCWIWPELLGEKPQGWDEMENYNRPTFWRRSKNKGITKDRIVSPLKDRVYKLIDFSKCKDIVYYSGYRVL